MLGIYARTSRAIDQNGIKTIEQQIEAGIDFAKRHDFDYQVFQDEGITGYTINEENESGDPYSNRPQFHELMKAIEKEKIDMVWVWENSRLSRNNYASAYIYQKFRKINKQRIEHGKTPFVLWIQEKKYDVENPHDTLIKNLMDIFAEYERNLIVSRTTRGLHEAINKGKRSFSKFYGYRKKETVNKAGNYEYEINQIELNNVKTAYEMFLNGKTLRDISLSLIETKPTEIKEILKISTKWGRILRHKEYTGYNLNTEGLLIEKQFDNGTIDNLNELRNIEKYWVISQVYPEKLITIEDWITVREQLQVYKNIRKNYTSNYSVGTSLGTGLVKCSCCNSKYHVYNMSYKTKNNENTRAVYYKHSGILSNKECSQKPKTIKQEKLDFILGFFYFYYTLLFDNANKRKQETIQAISEQKDFYEHEAKELEEKLKKILTLIERIENSMLNNPDNYEIDSKLLAKNETLRVETANKLFAINTKLLEIRKQYIGSMAKKEFRKVFDDWIDFFLKNNVETNRAKLSSIIEKGIVIYGYYLVIQTESIYFVFKLDKNDKSLAPYRELPIDIFDPENQNSDDEKKKDFIKITNELWNRFQQNNLDYQNIETQNFLKKTFHWKNFEVSNENIKLEEKISFPENSTVILFDETITESEKKQKNRERQQRYRDKKKAL